MPSYNHTLIMHVLHGTKLNTKTKKASSYAKQMYSLFSSIGQNVCNIA